MIKVARLLPVVAIKLFQFHFYQLNSKVIGNSGQKEKLTELLGEEVLPEEYGGTNGTIDEHRCFWKEEVNKQRDWLMKQPDYRTEESLRPEGPKTATDIFGSPSCSVM